MKENQKLMNWNVRKYLRNLLGDDNGLIHAEFILTQVQVSVEGKTFAHARHQRQSRKIHTRSHKQDQIFVPRFSKSGDLRFFPVISLLIISKTKTKSKKYFLKMIFVH